LSNSPEPVAGLELLKQALPGSSGSLPFGTGILGERTKKEMLTRAEVGPAGVRLQIVEARGLENLTGLST
jgi:hypothetical protein